ncbi:MAG: hypothetical protein WBY94_18805 [Polyangiaceae bacterium]
MERQGYLSALALVTLLLWCWPARAELKAPVVVWPTLTPAGDAPAGAPLHRPQAADKGLLERAQELDATLRDAVQDLGFTLDVGDPGPPPDRTRDADLLRRAQTTGIGAQEGGTWVISPRIEGAGGGAYMVRIVAAPPKGRELRVRIETVSGDSVYVRGLVMLRELLSPQAAAAAAVEQEREHAARGTSEGIMSPLHSEGRAVLAVNAALFGAFTAFGMQRAVSQSDDPRVLYPLLVVGTGIGIGSALLVADEWDVTSGDAWFLAAGGWWSAASGLLIAAGGHVHPVNDRYTWGVAGGVTGIGLATLGVTLSQMDDGDAALTHSGAALGLLLGGATEFLYRGTTVVPPSMGFGVGTAVGLLAAGTLATQVTVSPSRMLLIDLGVGGGALLGSAAASPLLFQNLKQPTESNTRGSISATLAGSVVGGAVAWWLTRDTQPVARPARIPGTPSAGIIGTSPTRGGATPIYGISWGGAL